MPNINPKRGTMSKNIAQDMITKTHQPGSKIKSKNAINFLSNFNENLECNTKHD